MAPENKTAIKPPPAHPLQSFGLANFKAFGAIEQQVPLRPITLVFGPNSSGKSSIIHYLLWMKDVVAGKGLDIYKPSAGGDSVDLGGFNQIRHGTVSATEICTRLSLTIKDSHQLEHKLETVSVFSSCQPPVDYAGKLESLITKRWKEIRYRNTFESLLDRIQGLEAAVVDFSLKELLESDYGESRVELDLMENEEGNEKHHEPFGLPRFELRKKHCPIFSKALSEFWSDLGAPSSALRESEPTGLTESVLLEEFQNLAGAILVQLNYTPPPQAKINPALIRFELSEGGEIRLKANRNEDQKLVLAKIDAAWFNSISNDRSPQWSEEVEETVAESGRLVFDGTSGIIPGELRVEKSETSLPLTPSTDRESDVFDRIIRGLDGTDEVPGLLRDCIKAARNQFQSISYLGPLRTYPDRDLTVADLPTVHDPEGLFSWRKLYEDEATRQSVNAWLRVHSNYEVMTDDWVSLAEVRQTLTEEIQNRIAIWSNNALAGQRLTDDLQTSQNYDWMYAISHWDYPTMIREAMGKVTSDSTGTLFLRDLRSGKQVTSRDIGVGVSQLIPVLVQAKAAKGEFIAIEQPEIHIHPALQAELGDVFIESALKQGNTFLIETHSEHLILRLMRRIRETTRGKLPEGAPALKPEHLAIIYVDPRDGGPEIRNIRLDDQGRFMDAWPRGFFEESFNELF